MSQAGVEPQIQKQPPGYMAMGEHGMGAMEEMPMGGPLTMVDLSKARGAEALRQIHSRPHS